MLKKVFTLLLAAALLLACCPALADEAQSLTGEKYMEVTIGDEVTFSRSDLSLYPQGSTLSGKSIEDYSVMITLQGSSGDAKEIWKLVSSAQNAVTVRFLKSGYYDFSLWLKDGDQWIIGTTSFTVCVKKKDGSKPALPELGSFTLRDIPTVAAGDTVNISGTVKGIVWPIAMNTIAVFRDGKMVDSWIVKEDAGHGQRYTPQETGEYTVVNAVQDQAGRSLEAKTSFTVVESLGEQCLTGVKYREVNAGDTITYLRSELQVTPEGSGLNGRLLEDYGLWVLMFGEKGTDYDKLRTYEEYYWDKNTIRYLTPGYYVCAALILDGSATMIESSPFTVCVKDANGSKPPLPEFSADDFWFDIDENAAAGERTAFEWDFGLGFIYPATARVAITKDGNTVDSWNFSAQKPRCSFVPPEPGEYTVTVSAIDQAGRSAEGTAQFTIK